MKVLFYLHHPAHYHLFKYIIKHMQSNGHTLYIIGTHKDVLEQLLQDGKIGYTNFLPRGRKNNLISIAFSLFKQDVKLLRFCLDKKPDLLVGTSTEITHIGSLLRIPSLFINEDDFNVIPLVGKVAYPFASCLVVPYVCNTGKYGEKTIRYSGYHELTYLYPKYFRPEKSIVEKYFSVEKDYFILRFSNLDAHHDRKIRGIDFEIFRKLLEILQPKGNVYITSERKLDPELEPFRLKINPADMHHIIAFTKMFIGDSQTMAAEAAVLGTPSVRFNDFVGRIGYLEELEHKYRLTFGIKTSEPQKLFEKIKELANVPNCRAIWQERRQKMLSEKIDVAAFMTWFIENYPESARIMKKNPDYQYKFN